MLLLVGGGLFISVELFAADNGHYVLVFSDEFDGPNGSQPDVTKWSRPWRNPSQWARWISNSPDVVYLHKGKLICRAIPNKKERTDTATMLTGAVETRGKFSFQYGKVEVRMRTNLRQGNFPAAWMKAEDRYNDVRYGEIDIVETYGYEGKSAHTLHTHRSYTLKKEGIQREFKHVVDVTKWHVYGVEWTHDSIIWTVDGETVGEYLRQNSPQMVAEGQWTFDCPFYIRLNQSVGNGNNPLMVPKVKKTYETQFDWIRVYQRK